MLTSNRAGTFLPLILPFLLAGAGGCDTSSALTTRETGGRNLSSYVMSLYDQPNANAGWNAQNQPPMLRLPIRAAVAQVGEVAPPEAVIKALSKQTDLFARIEPIPGVFATGYSPSAAGYGTGGYGYGNSYTNAPPTAAGDDKTVREEVQRMRRMAADMGLDYLLLVGGTIDHTTDVTGLSAADVTIIGAFVVPSRSINAEARTSAALIDVRTNRVVMTASAEARKQEMKSAVALGQGQTNLTKFVREDALTKAATQLALNCRERSASGGGLVAVPAGGPMIAPAAAPAQPPPVEDRIAVAPPVPDDRPATALVKPPSPPQPVARPASPIGDVREEFWNDGRRNRGPR